MRMPPVVVGVLLNSALYLTGCFVAGLLLRNGFAWRLALLAAGLTYVSYALQYEGNDLVTPVVWASIGAGVLAGLALLWPV